MQNIKYMKLPDDIARCKNEKCNLKTKCARYMDNGTNIFMWYCEFDENNCKHFVKHKNKLK